MTRMCMKPIDCNIWLPPSACKLYNVNLIPTLLMVQTRGV